MCGPGIYIMLPSSPLLGAPVVASFPHFYLAEDKYVAAIGGMSPKREHHQTFLDLNPVSPQAAFCLFYSAVTISDFWGHVAHLC